MTHREKLKAIQNKRCQKCPLYKSTTHVCIMGKGNALAPIMLVGEAPGAAEEETGQPFMGRSGKLLDKVLKELDMDSAVYITNPVKCRPPNNRKPTDKEIAACIHYLWAEIDIVKPRVIVALGRIAGNALGLGMIPIRKSIISFLYSKPNVLLIQSWHPSYCLRRGKGAVKDLRDCLIMAKEYCNVSTKSYQR